MRNSQPASTPTATAATEIAAPKQVVTELEAAASELPRQMVPTIDEQEEQQYRQQNHSQVPQERRQQEQQHWYRHSAAATVQPEVVAVAATPPATPTRYISSLISRSSTLINSLKQQYYSTPRSLSSNSQTANTTTTTTMHTTTSSIDSSSSSLADSTAASGRRTTESTTHGPSHQQQQQQHKMTSCDSASSADSSCPAPSKKPPIPPRPPPSPAHHQNLASSSKQRSLDVTNLQNIQTTTTNRLLNSGSGNLGGGVSSSGGSGSRRHALQEQSLERDAALSLKVHDKHKRTSSIKSALKHAHLGPLRVSSGTNSSSSSSSGSSLGHLVSKEKANSSCNPGGGGGGASCGGSGSGGGSQVKSMPYELFEPPVTQRTFQRSRRRGAMSQDPKRQMSADTIGLRQLTDEYLQNAGIKPISSSGQCSLVALTNLSSISGGGGQQSSGGVSGTTSSAATSGLVGLRHQDSCSGGGGAAAAATSGGCCGCNSQSSTTNNQQQQNIEAQLYQASKHLNARDDSQDSFSSVTILPGNLPWQSDVSIQCELLRPPLADLEEPYETTGDLLNTIAKPYRHHHHPHLQTAQQANSFDSLGGAATLKRKLTAISQHHLSPIAAAQNVPGTSAAALNVVVGNLKKSLSSTLDVGLLQATPYLHSQDSLPAYSSLKNEPDSPSDSEIIDQQHHHQPQQQHHFGDSQEQATSTCESSTDNNNNNSNNGGLIGQITSKITRQSSKKFSASKKGLQRALSFDYRGHKKLEVGGNGNHSGTGSGTTSRQPAAKGVGGSGGSHLLSAASKLASHNRSSLGLNHHHQTAHSTDPLAPRPYLPQSASQVDFQVPLLPYHKMQEAIVSQRLLDPSSGGGRCLSQSQLCQSNTAAATSTVDKQQAEVDQQPQLDADELLCVQPSTTIDSGLVELQQVKTNQQQDDSGKQQARTSLPRLVLDIPTIATHQVGSEGNNETVSKAITTTTTTTTTPTTTTTTISRRRQRRNSPGGASNQSLDCSETGAANEKDANDSGGEDACANEQDDSSRSTVIVCLPSPNISIEPRFGSLSNPSSFDLLQMHQQHNQQQEMQTQHHTEMQPTVGNFLSAQDIFSQSKNLIKRPSTMMTAASADDAINQVARAFNRNQQQQQQQQDSAALRNRRRAIVPPKLATDASSSDAEGANEGQLVDLDGDDDDDDDQQQQQQDQRQQFDEKDEEETMRALRRKRSGGGGGVDRKSSLAAKQQQALIEKRLSGSQTNIPTFRIDQDQQFADDVSDTSSFMAADTTRPFSGTPRPDSQMTNVDSIASSGSSLSISNKRGDLTVTSPGGLTVTFGSLKNRRRSSIAIIPQMQICPGDLLVYSKQMIDRMNQNELQDSEQPPSFLIDDKKGKNIWSSLKLCAQFDNRNQKARNELICSLEDVLASLQPSTFADEQLSRYKGMNWNDFLIETGSRRSVSTEALDNLDDATEMGANNKRTSTNQEDLSQLQISYPTATVANLNCSSSNQELARLASCCLTSTIADKKETVKVTLSSGPAQQQPPVGAVGAGHRSRDTTVKSSITSRFKEKPKLKRGQTVDSVFRIPLIPSSPLKHAQLHQQTPTAHLEQDNDLLIIEDDERSSPSATSQVGSREPSLTRNHTRSSSTRSRRDSGRLTGRSANSKKQQQQQNGTEAEEQREEDDIGQFESPGGDGTPVTSRPGSSSAAAATAATVAAAARQSAMMIRQSSLSTLSSTITRTEQKRQRALWDLFQSECTFFFDHLMTLKNVYMEPLKKIQVEGFAMFADPDVLFGNLDELCCGVYDFCKEFLFIIMRTLKTRPEELNATDVLIKLYKKNPKIDHLRGVYHRYTLNYINAITYLDSLRNQVEFMEFETWSSRDARCKKLQLTDLLVAPVQHIMRVPIILKDIESHTENPKDRDEIRAILAVEEASLRELDDKMRWLKNFERLLEIQKNIVWPTVYDMAESKLIPECLREILTKQPIERLIVSPWRQIVHEGTLSNLDAGKQSDMHVILFDDMLLLTRRKKALTKKASTICKTNSGSSSMRDDGSFKYNVYKQPLSLDRFTVHDIDPLDTQYKAMGVKYVFVLVVMNRFQQFTNVHNFSAPNEDIKQTWMFKMRKTQERWQRKQLDSSPNNQQQQQSHKQSDNQQAAGSYQSEGANQQRSKLKSSKPAADSSGQHSS